MVLDQEKLMDLLLLSVQMYSPPSQVLLLLWKKFISFCTTHRMGCRSDPHPAGEQQTSHCSCQVASIAAAPSLPASLCILPHLPFLVYTLTYFLRLIPNAQLVAVHWLVAVSLGFHWVANMIHPNTIYLFASD